MFPFLCLGFPLLDNVSCNEINGKQRARASLDRKFGCLTRALVEVGTLFDHLFPFRLLHQFSQEKYALTTGSLNTRMSISAFLYSIGRTVTLNPKTCGKIKSQKM